MRIHRLNFIRHVLATHAADRVVNLDKLTYAGNPANLADLANDSRYTFVQGDVCDATVVRDVIRGRRRRQLRRRIARRPLAGGARRVSPNRRLRRVPRLLEAVKELKVARFLHISTDEVYGSVERASSRGERSGAAVEPVLGLEGRRGPARAGLLAHPSGAGPDHPLVGTTSGPHQYPEKVVPLFVTNALDDKPLPLYGDGRNVRDWLYVLDNCAGIDLVLRKGARARSTTSGAATRSRTSS